MLNINKYFKQFNLLFNYKNAVRPLSKIELESIDKNKIAELKKNKHLLESLDKWILFADRNLIPDIKRLSAIIKSMEKQQGLVLYRGFNIYSVQENLNIANPKINSNYNYATKERAVSFSKSKEIAKAFGEILVETNIKNDVDYLEITNELNLIIHEMRNLKTIETQDEVILLPPFEIDFKVISIL